MPKKGRAKRPAAPPPKSTYSFDFAYGPDLLEQCGPLVRASWSIPAAQEAALRAAGLDSPSPVPGSLLLDTGASRTSIDLSVAHELGLQPTRLVRGYGATGDYELQAFFARMYLAIQSGQRRMQFAREQEVVGIPKLDEMGARMDIADGGGPVRIIGLLGRDILRHVKFSYDGVRGRVHFAFDTGSLPPGSKRKI